MTLAYYRRFNKTQKTIARKSDALNPIAIKNRQDFPVCLQQLEAHLKMGNVALVERSSQQIVDAICQPLRCGNMRVSSARVHVLEQRPHDDYGELHGLYEPVDHARIRARLYVWMKTAKRQQVVAYKTFLRTLIHELCHHLDYEYYQLDDSLHTQGFFQRESSLFKQLQNCRFVDKDVIK